MAFLGVALGAFAAHGLQGRLSPEAVGWWDTAVHYQFVHAAALLACGLMGRTGTVPRASAACFGLGALLFSGSLYAMALGAPRWLGMVTPVGGTAFLLGWALLLPHARPTRQS